MPHQVCIQFVWYSAYLSTVIASVDIALTDHDLCTCVQWTNDTVSNLLYNSDYFFDVEYEADRAKQSAHVTLRTPGCPMLIEDSFKRCARLGPPLTGASCVVLMSSA